MKIETVNLIYIMILNHFNNTIYTFSPHIFNYLRAHFKFFVAPLKPVDSNYQFLLKNMKKLFILFIVIIVSQRLSSQRITGIYTDFDYRGQGYWHANGSVIDTHTPPPNSDQPSNSHLLLAFAGQQLPILQE